MFSPEKIFYACKTGRISNIDKQTSETTRSFALLSIHSPRLDLMGFWWVETRPCLKPPLTLLTPRGASCQSPEASGQLLLSSWTAQWVDMGAVLLSDCSARVKFWTRVNNCSQIEHFGHAHHRNGVKILGNNLISSVKRVWFKAGLGCVLWPAVQGLLDLMSLWIQKAVKVTLSLR